MRGPTSGARWVIVWSFVCALAGCNGERVQSQWQTDSIAIDGDLAEWEGRTTILYVEVGPERVPLSVGVANDSERLYLSFATGDPGLQSRILTQGLTVWFDSDGGNDKKRGVRYPLGLEEMGLRAPETPRTVDRRGRHGTGEGPPSTSDEEMEGPPEFDSEHEDRARRAGDSGRQRPRMPVPSPERVASIQALYDEVGPELELIRGPYSFEKRIVADAVGVEVAERLLQSVLTYEISVQLATSDERGFAIGLGDASTIGLGVTIPAMERPQRGSIGPGRSGGGPGGNGPGGGRPGGRGPGGMGGPGMGGSGPPGRDAGFVAIEFWTRVSLSQDPDLSERLK